MKKVTSTGKEIISRLKKAGFALERQKGSHVFLKHAKVRGYG
ncbi:MAG: hypothetical protein COT35_13040 [Nitrospirae bacterium CG08_land_8_20_14_0_20_52_24]|nr:MAG: hypothetical protein COT35_13040 [Nitrospirae bacterium CG08_land_8_20_14_0_20_52_24]